jgi:cholesterol transport system auxiliary component
MSARHSRFAAAVAAFIVSAVSLTGCALMGGGGKPATFYQIGGGAAAAYPSAEAAAVGPVVILYAGSSFDRQTQGDRILTSTGNQAAYIAEARWIAPAQEMFDSEAVSHLESGPVPLQVVRAGAPPKPQYVLAIDVRRFEADYTSGSGVPDVIIDARAKLMRAADRQIVGDWPVTAREPARVNRVSEIVAAFDRATNSVTGQVAQLTTAAVRGR